MHGAKKSRRKSFDVFLESLLSDFEYSYVTIKSIKTNAIICEGFLQSLQKSFNIRALVIKSFKIFEVEDGSVLVDIYI